MFKVNVLAWALVAISVTMVSAQDGSKPAARADENSRIAHTQLLEKARRGGIDVYFEGDSITRRWGTSDPGYREFLDHWTRSFFDGMPRTSAGEVTLFRTSSGVSPRASWMAFTRRSSSSWPERTMSVGRCAKVSMPLLSRT